MPTAFQKELVTPAHRLADLCGLVASALEEATRALLESDPTLGGRAREQAGAAAALGAVCEDQACALLALHAPHEERVRAVVGAVHIAADLTRMGGLAREVADRVPRVPAGVARLGGDAVAAAWAVRTLLGEAGGAGAGGARVGQLVALAEAGERELRAQAGGVTWPHDSGAAVDVVLVAALFGRFAVVAGGLGRRVGAFAPGPVVSC